MADVLSQSQFVREAPDIEAQKVALMQSAKAQADATNAAALRGQYLNPDYNIASMSPDQLNAMDLGRQGIGAYQPFMTAAAKSTQTGAGTLGAAADLMAGADTRGQFSAAQAAMNQASMPIQNLGNSAQLATQGVPLIGQGAQGIRGAQDMANQYAQANLGQSQGVIGSAINMADRYAQADLGRSQGAIGNAMDMANQYSQANMNESLGALRQGIGTLGGAGQMYNPASAQGFMNPYQQQVIDESMRQINRQGDMAQQQMQAQAVRSGAFGGSRQGIESAELQRNLAAQKNAAITGALQQGYGAAQQQAQQAFEQQQQRQLAQAQGYQGMGSVLGQQSLQQAQLGQGAAGLQGNLAQTLGQQQLQQAQLGQGAAGLKGNLGQTLGQQQIQQAQLGQSAAGLQGNLSNQLAGLSGMYGNIAGQQANIYGQQAGLGMQQAQGIGGLAAQQFGIGSQLASGLAGIGTAQGNIGAQQGALGQATQQMGQQDVNYLYNMGAQQQKQAQAELDAERQNQLQQNMQPYQQLAFMSDIYKGAPSSQMSSMSQSAPTASPFQQIAGMGTGILSTAAAGKMAGVI